jgi:hypothetical protein
MRKKNNLKFVPKVIAIITVITTLFSLISQSAGAAFNMITPDQKDEEQIKFAIANNSEVIYKWSLLAHYLGFGWCGGTKYGTVGTDFSVKRTTDGNYELIANYREDDPYADGYRADDRLKITLSNFRVSFNSDDFQMQPAITTTSGQRVASSYVASNEGEESTNFSKEYSYSTGGEITHETNTTLGISIGMSTTVSANCMFGGVESTISTEFTAEHGWSDSTTKSTGDTITDTFEADVPAHTRRVIEQMTNDVISTINYKVNAEILYNVKFEGFLRNGGNAYIKHPTDRPTVKLELGNDVTSASEYLYDLYTHRNIPGYNTWIDWSWLETQEDVGASAINNLVVKRIYNSPEASLVEGKFTYKGIATSMRAGDPVPLYPLQTIDVTGTINPLFVGDTFNLNSLKLTGLDSKSTSYYNFDKLPIKWSIKSGDSFAQISGNTLTAKAQGSGALTATIGDVTSAPIAFSVKNLPALNELTLSGNIGDMYISDPSSGNFDLSLLTLSGKDQYGNSINPSIRDVTWNISGAGNASVSGNTLTATKPGQCSVYATINGISSNSLNFTVKAQKELKSIKLSGSVKNMYIGDTYPLANLKLEGEDQYGFPIDLTGLSIEWSTGSGNYAKISSDSKNIEAAAVGLDSVKVKIGNVTSNSIYFNIQKKPSLKTIVLTGTIPTLYVGEPRKDTYDTGNLTITAKDQYNEDFDISGKSVAWKIISGGKFAEVNSGIIKGIKEGECILAAEFDGITSSPISFSVKNPLILKKANLSGIIPTLTVGDNFDLSQLNLRGMDQYEDPMDLSSNKVEWTITSGKNSGSISGSFLAADAEGFGTVTATVYSANNTPVTSNPLVFSVKSPTVLKSVVVTGTIPPQITNESFDLSKLSVDGFDQYGNPFDISSLPIEWKLAKGSYNASISGKTLNYNAQGDAILFASVLGINSNSINLLIKDSPALNKLIVSGSIPTFSPGSIFDLTNLKISGKDQYGNDFDISKENIVFTIISGEKYASVFGKYLTASNENIGDTASGTLIASILGVVTEPIPFKVQKGASTITPTPVPTQNNTPITSTTTTTTTAVILSSDATLRSLNIEGITFSPLFKPDILLYTSSVTDSASSPKITYETSDPNATVKIAGADNLNDGQNIISIVVTAQDGTVKTYSIILNKIPGEKDTEGDTTTKEPDNKVPSAITFTDLKGHWAEEYMYNLVSSGILVGYNDGTIRPDTEITRAELAVILVKALGLKASDQTSSEFKDSNDISSWAKGYVETAAKNGIILGYQDKTFRPNKVCIRQEMLAMIMRAFKLGESDNEINFADKNTIHNYARKFVSKASILKIIVGFPDNTFRPLKDITRSEAATLVEKSLGLIKK